MTTTKDKLEFALAMGRHTRATLRQVQALMRYATSLNTLAVNECNGEGRESGSRWSERDVAKRERIRQQVMSVIADMDKSDHPRPANGNLYAAVFSGDPRGAVLKIRVPDGFTNDMGREGICVPS